MDHKWLCDKYLDQPGFNGVWEDEDGFVLSYNDKCPLKTRAWLRVRKLAGRWPVKFEKSGEIRALDILPTYNDFFPEKETAPLSSRLDKHRPAVGGISIGHVDITAGTLGGFVKLNIDDTAFQVFAQTNNHVAANSNDATIGDNIVQPGKFDGGKEPEDRFSVLADFVPIKFDGTSNFVDLALVGPLDESQYKKEILDVARYPTAWRDIGLGWDVYKSGRTTERTKGKVTGTNATLNVGYGDGKTARYREQFIVQGKVIDPEPCTCAAFFGFSLCFLCTFFDLPCCGTSGEREKFSGPGDSGSWVLAEDRGTTKFVGLLFAGSDTQTIMNHPRHVFGAFGGTELL